MAEELPTNCIATRQLTKIEKPSAFSIIQQETYTSYDTCNHTIVREYKDWNLTYPFATIVLLSLVLGIFICMLIDEKRRKNGRS